MALFHVDFSGHGELSERQYKVLVSYFVWLATLFINIFAACSAAQVQLSFVNRQLLSKLSSVSFQAVQTLPGIQCKLLSCLENEIT